MKKLCVDFGKEIRDIKPMHACGGGPKQGGAYLSFDASKEFKDLGIPYCRLHDIEGAYSMMQFVDVHNIFQDFDADVDDPTAYNFLPTDAYLQGIKECGSKVFYRLGSSIEHFKKKLFIFPPKDYLKYAQVCEHIIRHYNRGWNNGFYWEIEHWEIWNEPESAGMWQGTREEFYEFYRVLANYLKGHFPELKIGGYSSVGFYTETRENNTNPWFKTIVPTLDGFMKYITAEETKAPLDFFSWHCYAENPEEVAKAGKFIRKYLDDHGFASTESYLTEYNTFQALENYCGNIPHHAAEVGATFIEAQNAPIDILFYYDLRLGFYNNAFIRGRDWTSVQKLQGYYTFKFFNNLYQLKKQVDANGGDKQVYVLAAKNGVKGGIMLAVRDYEGEVEIDLKNAKYVDYTVSESTFEKVNLSVTENKAVNGKLTISVQKDTLYYIENI